LLIIKEVLFFFIIKIFRRFASELNSLPLNPFHLI